MLNFMSVPPLLVRRSRMGAGKINSPRHHRVGDKPTLHLSEGGLGQNSITRLPATAQGCRGSNRESAYGGRSR